MSLTEELKDEGIKRGLEEIRITRANPFEGYIVPESKRRDPCLTILGARSLIVVGAYIGAFAPPDWEDSATGRTSRLFLSGFYHDIVEPLKPLSALVENHGFQAQICDSSTSSTSSIPLKLAAVRAGMGWQGKNTLLVSNRFGSFLALGGIITDAPLEYDSHIQKDHCGKCTACLDACPTNALFPYRLVRNQCLSHILEQRGPLTADVIVAMGNRIVECETCQDVCPCNSHHLREPLITNRGAAFQRKALDHRATFNLKKLASLTLDEYTILMAPYGIPLSYLTFRRNVMGALARSGLSYAKKLLENGMHDLDSSIGKTAEISRAMLT